MMAEFYLRVVQEDLLMLFWEGMGLLLGRTTPHAHGLSVSLTGASTYLVAKKISLSLGQTVQKIHLHSNGMLKFLFDEISEIEKKTVHINGTEVKFHFSVFFNDLKMLAFLVGELPVSATYFSTFANVNTKNCDDVNGTFGLGLTHTWQPWDYSQRVAISEEVDKLELKLEKQRGSNLTKRSKITSFIADKKSRQEFVPLVGSFVDRAHIDPLHPKNNACQQVFRNILYESIGKSALEK